MNNISKYFPVNDTHALIDMKLEVLKGEIHAIVGENGAGKSTLMKILHNIEKCDSGNITILGNTGMVSQHFKLIEDFSIIDNIIIGSEPTHNGIFINRTKAQKKILQIFDQYGFFLDLNKKIKTLSIGQKQLIEIIKVIYNDSEILIFDEPTATLSEHEAVKLRNTILSLKSNGKTVIIISHKIRDISTISDRFTIIRKGHFVETIKTSNVNISEISRHMSGENIIQPLINTTNSIGDTILTFNHKSISVSVHEREIIGITGYGGCGLHLIEEKLEKMSLENSNIGYAPSDRLSRGVELDSPLKETLIAKNRHQFTRFGFLLNKKINKFAKTLLERFNIKGTIDCQTGTLSGGNLQKSVLARVLTNNPKALILSSPTWGIDLESSNNIYSRINNYKKQDCGIILLSHDIEEILKLSNRILVLYKNKIIKEVINSGEITTHQIGKLSSGILDE